MILCRAGVCFGFAPEAIADATRELHQSASVDRIF